MTEQLTHAINKFEELHKNISSQIFGKLYMEYCQNNDMDGILQGAKRCLEPKPVVREWGRVKNGVRSTYTPKKQDFEKMIKLILSDMTKLLVLVPDQFIDEIIKKEPICEKTVDELFNLFQTYRLISFHAEFFDRLNRFGLFL